MQIILKISYKCLYNVNYLYYLCVEIVLSHKPVKMDTIQRVWEHSKNSPYGFTLNIETFEIVRFGISVAYLETQNCFDIEGLEKVVNHALKHEKLVGGWHNDENGKYYFDSVKVFKNKEKAIEFGKANKQIAIFDITNNEEIKI